MPSGLQRRFGAMGMRRGFGRRRRHTPAPLPWSPAEDPDLEQWYRADLGVTLVDGAVSVAADQGSHSRDVSQGSAGFRPGRTELSADMNDRATFDFAPTQWLRATGFTVTQSFGILLACRDTGSGTRVPVAGAATPAVVTWKASTSSGSWNLNASASRSASPAAQGTIDLVRFVVDGGASAIYVNDWVNAADEGNAGDNDLSGLTMGARQDDAVGWSGAIAEVVITKATDPAILEAYRTYLARYEP